MPRTCYMGDRVRSFRGLSHRRIVAHQPARVARLAFQARGLSEPVGWAPIFDIQVELANIRQKEVHDRAVVHELPPRQHHLIPAVLVEASAAKQSVCLRSRHSPTPPTQSNGCCSRGTASTGPARCSPPTICPGTLVGPARAGSGVSRLTEVPSAPSICRPITAIACS
jgi:hypothetical protein